MPPRVRRIALVCGFLSICLVALVRMPSNTAFSDADPQDVERLMMERYARSLQFKGKVRIKSLASSLQGNTNNMDNNNNNDINFDNNRDDTQLLPRSMTRKERGTTVYFPSECNNTRRHWQICRRVVPSFIIAGAEQSAADVLYETLRTHPQVWDLVKANEIYERTGSLPLLDLPNDQDAPFFASQNYNDIDSANTNLEMYLKQFPSMKDIPVLPQTRAGNVGVGAALPHLQHHMAGSRSSRLGRPEKVAQQPSNMRILVGESAPSYLHMDGASMRISSTIPEMKAIFIFRDPIDRAYLDYHAHKQYAAGYSFEEIIAEELSIIKECVSHPESKKWTQFLTCHAEEAAKTAKRMGLPNRPRANNARDAPAPLLDLIIKGLYYSQLNEFVKNVPFPKVLVLRTEDLYDKKSTVATMAKLAQFLNIDTAPFTNFPIEISTDPMASLRGETPNKGLNINRANGSHNIVVRDEDDDLMESLAAAASMDDEGDAEAERRRVPSSRALLPDGPLDSATRTRLERVFKPFNQKLVDMFEHRQDFAGWSYA
ncbi:hypothetical protein BGZ94_004515 [Podila epigama]|nr:hypothetical protein BGZ94_004515 [Podila epigama]